MPDASRNVSEDAPASGTQRTRVWIDTDPSIGLLFHDADDAFALSLAVASPELEIVGISVSYGNTSRRNAQEIASSWAAAAGIDKVLLLSGAEGPGNGRSHAAASALLAASPCVYVALGPLSHLADLFSENAEAASRIQRVVMVGGRSPGTRLRIGNRLPYEFHDANFEKDPAAMEVVLRSGCPIDLVPVELGPACMLLPSDFDRLSQGGRMGRWLCQRGRNWLRGWRWGFGMKGAPCFDLPAVGALTHPEKLQWELRYLSIQPGRPPQLAAAKQGPGRRVNFCIGIDSIFAREVVERIAATNVG